MPDRRVQTWESKLWVGNLEQLTTKSEFEEHVILCVSPQTRELILSMLRFYGYWPTRWRADDSSPTGSVGQETITEIVDSAIQEVMNIVACETDFTAIAESTARIATAVEDWYDRSYIDFFDLKAGLEAAGLGKWVNLLEVFEEFGDVFGAIPDFDFNLKIPTAGLMTLLTNQLWRKNLLAKIDDITAMMRGQIISESGPSAPLIIDALTQLIPGWSVADLILGDADELLQAIPAALITTLLGNYMTNRTKDVADAIEDLTDLTGLVEAVQGIESKCELCGASGGCGCQPPAYGTIQPDPEEQANPTDDPPPAGFSSWDDYFAYKCAAANRMVDDFIATVRATGGLAAAIPNVVPLESVSLIIGTALSQWATFGLMRLGFNTSNGAAIIINELLGLYAADPRYLYDLLPLLADELEDTKADVVCALFEVTSSTDARFTTLPAWTTPALAAITYPGWASESTFSTAMGIVRFRLFSLAVTNVLFQYDVETAAYIGDIDCGDCADCVEYGQWPNKANGGGGTPSNPSTDVFSVVADNDTLDGNYRAAIGWDINPLTGENCGEFTNYTSFSSIAITSGSVTPISGGFPTWRLYDVDGDIIYSSNDTPPAELFEYDPIGSVLAVSSTAFTVEYEMNV